MEDNSRDIVLPPYLIAESSAQWRHDLEDCISCPRKCHTNRLIGSLGYCKTDAGFHISSICIHKGEEPPISGRSGICNVFFSRCNLQCIYCQNHQISTLRSTTIGVKMELKSIVDEVLSCFDAGCRNVGFVSPSHQIVQMKAIIQAVRKAGRNPVFVYNTNAYDTVESLRSLEGLIDVYLPDMKYMDYSLAKEWSKAANYPAVAMAALREMFRQKGSTIRFGDDGIADSGLIVRHLVLPGQVQNSIDVLRFIAWELSPRVHISLMSQYYPTVNVRGHALLGRRLHAGEYARVIDEMENLGLTRGWVQESASHASYRPDFEQEHPFEH